MKTEEIKKYITQLLSKNGINVSTVKDDFLERFISGKSTTGNYTIIKETQKNIMNDWTVKHKQYEIDNVSIIIPNATKGVSYSHQFDFSELTRRGAENIKIEGVECPGLDVDATEFKLTGTPEIDGIRDVKIIYTLENDECVKNIQFIINPNPRDLWQKIESDKDAIYWKEDDASLFKDLEDKKVVISSKRGRSHQNVGSFRDDDFAFKHFDKTGWSLVVVSDGAGSAKLSRKGSQFACNKVVEFMETQLPKREIITLDNLLKKYANSKDEDDLKKCKEVAIKNILYKSTTYVHEELQKLSEETKQKHPELFENTHKKPIDLFHATLIYAIFKKVEGLGYVILTFGVGDCPIGLISKDKTKAKLINWLDVGEFGGGTRFITQNEIFHSNDMGTRFGVNIENDFSFLFLMTDGIYDAKFVVEANLEKTEKWLDFVKDLEGENEDDVSLDFSNDDTIEENLNRWMDFWSKGNHDDRTLAIVY